MDNNIIQKEDKIIIKNNQIDRRFEKPQITLDTFWNEMRNFMREYYRVLKAHSRLILVVGKFKKNYLKYEYIIILD